MDLDPARSGEANKRRPAVIVSNDGANRSAERLGRGVITVVPITTNTTRIYPFQVLLPATRCRLPADSKAQAEQIRAVSVNGSGSASVNSRPTSSPTSTPPFVSTSASRHPA